MKTPNSKLRQNIFSKLNENIALNGSNVPVFEMMAEVDTEYPYIIIGASTVIPGDINKNIKMHTAAVVIDINTDASKYIGTTDADDITNQATELLDVIEYDMGDDFEMHQVDIDSIQTVPADIFTTQNIVRNLLNMRYRIQEK